MKCKAKKTCIKLLLEETGHDPTDTLVDHINAISIVHKAQFFLLLQSLTLYFPQRSSISPKAR